jgi:5-methyltetrahydrofolate--homocysteine methyltransferase
MSLETIYDAVLNGDAGTTEAEVKAALDAGTPPEDILYKACIPAMEEVGRLFEEGEKFVPEMLISARAMQTSRRWAPWSWAPWRVTCTTSARTWWV